VVADERPIFLIGFMGSGKSTVATHLARTLGWDVVDTDAEVRGRAGCTIEAIFRKSGESRFRDLEREVLRSLDGRSRCVVATGGGSFAMAEPRRFMKRCGRTVWLDVPLEVCARRVGLASVRPLWNPGNPLEFRAFFEQRRAVYALAHIRLAGLTDDPGETVRRLLDRLCA